ncbi:hypothetical protein Hanom_Chr17g01556511 [Helianthus anomalus]
MSPIHLNVLQLYNYRGKYMFNGISGPMQRFQFKENKYQYSMPTIEGFACYIPHLCGDIVVKVLTF